MCRNAKQLLGAALLGAGVGMVLSLIFASPFLSILLAIGLAAAGFFLIRE